MRSSQQEDGVDVVIRASPFCVMEGAVTPAGIPPVHVGDDVLHYSLNANECYYLLMTLLLVVLKPVEVAPARHFDVSSMDHYL